MVTVPPGPLIRVEGQPVSIRCDVTDYSGPREQVSETPPTPVRSRPGLPESLTIREQFRRDRGMFLILWRELRGDHEKVKPYSKRLY